MSDRKRSAEVRLVDLAVIKRYSIAVRQEWAPAAEVLAALDASRELVRAQLPTATKASAKKASAKKAPAKKASARKASARKALAKRAVKVTRKA